MSPEQAAMVVRWGRWGPVRRHFRGDQPYFVPNGSCLVRVVSGSGWFRPGTNDADLYFAHVEQAEWRRTQAEAQADLDALAARVGLVAVPPEMLEGLDR